MENMDNKNNNQNQNDESQSKEEKNIVTGITNDPSIEDELKKHEMTAEQLKAQQDEEIKGKRILAAQEKSNGKFKIRNRVKNFNKHFGKFKKATDSLGSKKKLNFSQYSQKLKEDLIKSFEYLSKKENLKKVCSNKQNIAIALSSLALIVSIASLSSAYSITPIDKNNAFVKLTEMTPEQLGYSNNSIGKSSGGEFAGVNKENSLDPDLQPAKGLTFNSDKEFKAAVLNAINSIKADEVKKLLESRYKKYEAAPEKGPKDEKIYGNVNARFKIYEYSDLECPYCKPFFNVPKEIADISGGQVSVVWKNFPLNFHDPKATQEAIAAECAFQLKGNRAAWVALDRIFETTMSNGKGSFVLENFASEMGIPSADYLNCIADSKTIKAVQRDKDQAIAEGINSTPSLVIVDTLTGQKEKITGGVGADVIMNTIEAMNAKSVQLKPIQTRPDTEAIDPVPEVR